MKKFSKLFIGLLAAGSMVGCTNDDLPGNADNGQLSPDEKGGYFMSMTIRMPNGSASSRSTTVEGGGSSAGIEFGQDSENTVSNALIILADDNNGFIAAGEVAGNRLSPVNDAGNPSYTAMAQISKTNLNTFYNNYQGTNNPVVKVFVFCNPTNELSQMFSSSNINVGSTDWVDATCTVIQGVTGEADKNTGIWSANSFLMGNVAITKRMLPKALLDWEKFQTQDNPFQLSGSNGADMPDNSSQADRGPIKVERAVARLDFKDGSKNGDQIYNVLYHYHGQEVQKDEPLFAVQLKKVSLVNMSNKFYYLPRVSDNGMPAGSNFEICGYEKPWGRDPNTGAYKDGNYVVTPYATTFSTPLTTNFSKVFNYPFFEDDGTFNTESMVDQQWDVYKIENILKGTNDNYENGSTAKGSYKIWRYVTENAIPGGPDKQLNGNSTGMVFKAKILGTDFAETLENSQNDEVWERGFNSNLAKCLNGKTFMLNGISHNAISGTAEKDPLIFYFQGCLYLGWEHMRQAAIEASVTIREGKDAEINRSNSLYKAVFGNGPVPQGNKYIFSDGSEVPFVDPQWDSEDGQAAWKQSPDYFWTQWNEAGRPVSNDKKFTAMRDAVVGAGVTIYESSKDSDYGAGYYCYYYYWNRHNDNGMQGVMGPMEFATVRNNVYKLSVDDIMRLGHPRIPANDPDAPKPDTPDESQKIFIAVSTEIADWAVRLNGIIFQ